MASRAIRVAYFGTPNYAVPTLRALSQDSRYEVALVVTQPDRPAGRGRELHSSPVKMAAGELGIAAYQPASLRDAAAREPLAAIGADLFVVAAYGLIFGRTTLALPRYGCLNLHASLLPNYRGASPVAAAILAGDELTGVSLMLMEAGLDTGPVIDSVQVPISPTETTESLTARLATAGAMLAVDSAGRFVEGEMDPRPQVDVAATTVRPLVKADGWLDWSAPAIELDRRVRAMWSWPRAWTTFRGAPMQIHQAAPLTERHDLQPGEIEWRADGVLVGTGNGALRLVLVQAAGATSMPGDTWARGSRIESGMRLGQEGTPNAPPPLITRPS